METLCALLQRKIYKDDVAQLSMMYFENIKLADSNNMLS